MNKPVFRAAIIGNPNTGKSSIYNALTGSNQVVGNWPGVTVEKSIGTLDCGSFILELADLPGVYSLAENTTSQDEQIALSALYKESYQLIINVVDSTNLERNLYLTVQLLEMNVPILLVCNMLDLAQKRNYTLDVAKLQQLLHIPVVAINAKSKSGITALQHSIVQCYASAVSVPVLDIYPEVINEALHNITAIPELVGANKHHAIALLEGNAPSTNLSQQTQMQLEETLVTARSNIASTIDEDIDLVIASVRYEFIHNIGKQVLQRPQMLEQVGDRLDHIVLHRFWSIPIFLLIMYLTFTISILAGGGLQPIIVDSAQPVINSFHQLLVNIGLPHLLVILLADNIGGGVALVLSFVPVIAVLYTMMALLEDSGYMARAAFITDRLLKMIGLPGKALIPLIVGFGCNVPGIMATRILDNRRDRIALALMMPFMSCSARLSVYSLFCAAFFVQSGYNVVFALYLIGIAVALFTGFICRGTLLAGEPTYFVMELPNYHIPHLRNILWRTYHNTKVFMIRAGKLIVLVFMIINGLSAIGTDGRYTPDPSQSVLAKTAQTITPIFAPLGLRQDNWPATVGIVSGILAKEVVIGTLDVLYRAEDQHSKNYELTSSLQEHFDGKIGAFAYLLFILLYFPCASTFAVIAKELGARWAVVSMAWSTTVGYIVAVAFYQIAQLL